MNHLLYIFSRRAKQKVILENVPEYRLIISQYQLLYLSFQLYKILGHQIE